MTSVSPLLGAPSRGRVLEGELWDGSDVLPGVDSVIVTGRFVAFALLCNAAAFVARPCLVDISRCNSRQIQSLKTRRYTKPDGG